MLVTKIFGTQMDLFLLQPRERPTNLAQTTPLGSFLRI
jgi:hypothetical protein